MMKIIIPALVAVFWVAWFNNNQAIEGAAALGFFFACTVWLAEWYGRRNEAASEQPAPDTQIAAIPEERRPSAVPQPLGPIPPGLKIAMSGGRFGTTEEAEKVTSARPRTCVLASGLNLPVYLKYIDSVGEVTSRQVTIRQIDGKIAPNAPDNATNAPMHAFRGFCHLRKRQRTFVLSGIEELVDAETGEVIADPPQWLAERAGLPHTAPCGE